MLKLSKRLQTIADLVAPGARVADIGSDHALLPTYLVQTGRSPSAIAGELNAGPLAAAKKQVKEAGLEAKIDVRQGDGLDVLQAGEADAVTIAGMGGSLMATILSRGAAAGKLDGVRELVLQPNVGEELVRSWLLDEGWLLTAEEIVEEDGRWYEVLRAVRSSDADALNGKLYDTSFLPSGIGQERGRRLLLRMGPLLLRRGEPLLGAKWAHELEKMEYICRQLSLSETPEAKEKEAGLRRDMDEIKEVLACLPMDKRSCS